MTLDGLGDTYPLPRPAVGDGDARFTFGMIRDVAAVLAERGYPAVAHGGDHVRLQQALFTFLYGDGCAS